MWTIVGITASVFGTVIGAIALVGAFHHASNLFSRVFDVRLAPGYELPGYMVYVSGPRDIDPAFLGGADPSKLVYHEKGLFVFSREWSRRMWINSVMLSLIAGIVFALVGYGVLYYSAPYLWAQF